MTKEDFIRVLEYPRDKPYAFTLSNYEVNDVVNDNGIIKANVTFNDNDSFLKLPNMNITKFEIKNSNVYYIFLGIWQVAQYDTPANILKKNQITSFKATNCPNLQYLFFGDNKLTEIDLTTMPALKGVNFHDNDLSDLDISNCPNIKDISIVRNNFTTVTMDRIVQELINRNVQNCFLDFQMQKTGQKPTESLRQQFLALSTSNYFSV